MTDAPRDDAFEALWQRHGLARVKAALAFDETVTARTVAAIEDGAAVEELALGRLSFTAPQLPHISLGPGDGALEGDPTRIEATTAHDLLVVATLGEGGMGKVLLARQRSLSRDVAVKVLKGNAPDEECALSLLREAVVMGGLEHPNIIPVHALGRDDDGRPVLVMKRVEGTSWKSLLGDAEHPAWRALLELYGDRRSASLEVLLRVADASHFAHSRGVVHRDIKPENVMIGAFGEVYLVDWGIALRLGHARTSTDGAHRSIRGTPAYMAPEMIDGDPARIDARTDVYLLGATLHDVLTGSARHHAPSLHGVLYAAYTSVPVSYPSEVPEELAELCNAATHVDPAQRPQSAQDFRKRLADYLQHRASLMLSSVASKHLDALTEALGRSLSEADLARVHNLATECRFGFVQALQVWDGNARAREGLERALRLMLDHELARESLDAARALVDALRDDSPDTRARLDALQESLRLRREREAAALREADESDFTRGVHARLPLFGAAAIVSVTITALTVSSRLRGGEGLSLQLLAGANMVMCAVFALGILLARRQLLVNRINRQLSAFIFLCLFTTLVHRLVALALPTTPPLSLVVLDDQLILASLLAAAALALRPWLAWMSAWAALGCVVTLCFPAHAGISFTVTGNGLMLIAVYFGWVRERRAI